MRRVLIIPLIFLASIVITGLGCSCANSPKHLDPQSAVAANDLSSITGCGGQIGVGYIVCRVSEGIPTTETITVHAPPNISCDDEKACVYFKIFFPTDGRQTYEGMIKKGESYAAVPWSVILDKSTFELRDHGLFGVSVTIKFKGPDGLTMSAYSDGYIFLRVIKRDYESLNESPNDENFIWTWTAPETGQTIKMTTGGRVYVSPPTSSRGNTPGGLRL